MARTITAFLVSAAAAIGNANIRGLVQDNHGNIIGPRGAKDATTVGLTTVTITGDPMVDTTVSFVSGTALANSAATSLPITSLADTNGASQANSMATIDSAMTANVTTVGLSTMTVTDGESAPAMLPLPKTNTTLTESNAIPTIEPLGPVGTAPSGWITLPSNGTTISVSMTPQMTSTSSPAPAQNAPSSSQNAAGPVETGSFSERGAVGLALAIFLPAIAL